MTEAILPGATIGILGGGQLGRMLALVARRRGYRIHCLAPEAGSPTGQVADEEFLAPYDDLEAVRQFAKQVDVVTLEFENIPSAALEAVEELVPVRPGRHVLHVAQHRAREKTFLRDHGFPLADFAVAHSLEEVREALGRIGLPAVLKTAAFGYDGKGQSLLQAEQDAADAWQKLAPDPVVLEKWIDFAREVSVVVARNPQGDMADHGMIINDHANHILDTSRSPSEDDAPLARAARELARDLMCQLDGVGVLCVEFFVTRDGDLLVNEMAPRPHNSGHLTIEACVTNQFEQQLRAVTGLALGATELVRPAAMANLLGDLWRAGEPDWEAVFDLPEVRLHLYGKREARPGRKMGHLTATASTPEAALQRVVAARDALVHRIYDSPADGGHAG